MKKAILILTAIVALFFVSQYVLPDLIASFGADPKVIARGGDDDPANDGSKLAGGGENKKEEVLHIKTPDPVKSLYMTSCVVGTPSLRNTLVKIAEDTEINSLVIDIKDFSGTLSYKPENPDLQHGWRSSKCGASDMKEFVKSLHEKGIYVIGRITVFQDPHMSALHPEWAVRKYSDGGVWKDNKGLSFIDVGAKPHWDYIVALSKDAYALGFDELNYDYVRFPSDGPMKDASYTWSKGLSKPESLEKFFQYFKTEADKIGVVTSVDLFGMVTTNTDDLNIGQVLERALPYFDYVAPMTYPSHWPKGWNGFANPNSNPYGVVKVSMGSAVKRAAATSTVIKTLSGQPIASTSPQLYTKPEWSRYKLRTWIQDFDYGGNYDIPEVKAQINATYDVGLSSWMIWSPSNKYTVGALMREVKSVSEVR